MTALVLALQVVLPLALIASQAFLPAGSLAGFVLQAAGAGAFLFALALVAQWAVPVWWLPWAYGGLWLLAVLVGVMRGGHAGAPLLPGVPWGWAGLGLSVILLALGGWYGARALAGRTLPPVAVVDIANPFGPGRYLVASGGSTLLVNAHMWNAPTEVVHPPG